MTKDAKYLCYKNSVGGVFKRLILLISIILPYWSNCGSFTKWASQSQPMLREFMISIMLCTEFCLF